MNGDLFACRPVDSLYNSVRRDFPMFYHLHGVIRMATKSVVSPAEKQVIADALDMYVKSLERAEKAAKDAAIAVAYRDAAGKVRSLSARVMSGELEV